MSKKFLTVLLSVLFVNAVFSQSLTESSKDFSQPEYLNKEDLTAQFLNQKSDLKKVELAPAKDKKSAGIAMLLSLLVPGAGHLYINRMDVGKFFVMGEAASWIGLAGLNIYGDALQEDYKTFAVQNAGVNKTGKDKDYFSNVGNFNSVYDYNNDKLLKGQYTQLYDVNTYYWNWNNVANRDDYENQRKTSERVYNSRVVFGTTLIINRVVSALSALILTNKRNNATTLNIQPELMQKDYGVDGLKLNISTNF
ncbi:MAG: hypothetical protein K1X86_15180 [Ignavibacteria bacterium]|nr:hypothetical protein [Ignavibacteria bacterium]